MLATVVVVTIPLAWIAKERRQSRYEQQIAQQLELSGALIKFGGRFDAPYPSNPLDPAEEPTWWREALSRLCGDRVLYVNVLDKSNPKFTDASHIASLKSLAILGLDGSGVSELEPLGDLKALQTLSLAHTQVTDVTALVGLKNLSVLWLSDTQVSDIKPLAGLIQLRILDLARTNVTNLTPLVGLMNLKVLDLRGTKMPEQQIIDLQKSLPNCKITHDRFH